jgi:hypothetical protein
VLRGQPQVGSHLQIHRQPALVAEHRDMLLQRTSQARVLQRLIPQIEEQRAHLHTGPRGKVQDRFHGRARLSGLGLPEIERGLGHRLQAKEGLRHRIVQVASRDGRTAGRARRSRHALEVRLRGC